jgi:hypothetical protein
MSKKTFRSTRCLNTSRMPWRLRNGRCPGKVRWVLYLLLGSLVAVVIGAIVFQG